MKQEYKIKEVFDENERTIQEKLQETFINYLMEKVNNCYCSDYNNKNILISYMLTGIFLYIFDISL